MFTMEKIDFFCLKFIFYLGRDFVELMADLVLDLDRREKE